MKTQNSSTGAVVERAVRRAFHDSGAMMTYDAIRAMNAAQNHPGMMLGQKMRAHDGKFFDSTGAFLVGELERLDQTLHMPLAEVSWSRDIDVREDVTIADEVSSYTVSTFGAIGGLGTNTITGGKAWAGKTANQVTGVGLDIGKITQPLTLWLTELKYSIPELESAAKLGRPIDQQKYDGMQLKYQMDVDAQVYIGDTDLGVYGLLNSDSRTGKDAVTNFANVPNGVSGSPNWTKKSADEILTDVNEIIVSAWTQAGFAVMPNKLLVPPVQFGYISTQKVSLAGNVSILKYLQENSIRTTTGLGKLEILPCKWNVGAGVGGTIGTTGTVDRLVAYTQDKQRVRFPMTLLAGTPIQYNSIYHMRTYYGRLGLVEIVYPECISYRDGI